MPPQQSLAQALHTRNGARPVDPKNLASGEAKVAVHHFPTFVGSKGHAETCRSFSFCDLQSGRGSSAPADNQGCQWSPARLNRSGKPYLCCRWRVDTGT